MEVRKAGAYTRSQNHCVVKAMHMPCTPSSMPSIHRHQCRPCTPHQCCRCTVINVVHAPHQCRLYTVINAVHAHLINAVHAHLINAVHAPSSMPSMHSSSMPSMHRHQCRPCIHHQRRLSYVFSMCCLKHAT